MENNKTIQNVLVDLIETDDSFKPLDYVKIKKIYKISNEETKHSINEIFTHLCGFPLNYLIEEIDNGL